MTELDQSLRYQAIPDPDGTWSVIETDTELAVLIRGVPMVLLTEETAVALANFMNTNIFINDTIH